MAYFGLLLFIFPNTESDLRETMGTKTAFAWRQIIRQLVEKL